MTSETPQAEDVAQSGELLRTGLPPANDRMLTTLFLAALVHGIIILGVTFTSSGNHAAEGDGPALEVVLVNDQAPSVANNPKAAYLAQRSQSGSGNTLKRERALIPRSSLMAANRPGIPDGEGVSAQQAGSDLGDDEVIAAHGPSPRLLRPLTLSIGACPATTHETSSVRKRGEGQPSPLFRTLKA